MTAVIIGIVLMLLAMTGSIALLIAFLLHLSKASKLRPKASVGLSTDIENEIRRAAAQFK